MAVAARTYRIPEPFERALKSVREAIGKDRLTITTELDVSRRIQREWGIGMGPCRILCVDCPQLLLEAMAMDVGAGVLLPLHVVVAGRGPLTLVHIIRPAGTNGSGGPADTVVNKLRARLSRALEKVGMRESLCRLA